MVYRFVDSSWAGQATYIKRVAYEKYMAYMKAYTPEETESVKETGEGTPPITSQIHSW